MLVAKKISEIDQIGTIGFEFDANENVVVDGSDRVLSWTDTKANAYQFTNVVPLDSDGIAAPGNAIDYAPIKKTVPGEINGHSYIHFDNDGLTTRRQLYCEFPHNDPVTDPHLRTNPETWFVVCNYTDNAIPDGTVKSSNYMIDSRYYAASAINDWKDNNYGAPDWDSFRRTLRLADGSDKYGQKMISYHGETGSAITHELLHPNHVNKWEIHTMVASGIYDPLGQDEDNYGNVPSAYYINHKHGLHENHQATKYYGDIVLGSRGHYISERPEDAVQGKVAYVMCIEKPCNQAEVRFVVDKLMAKYGI